MPKKPKTTRPGTVQKIISGSLAESEKAQIDIEGADQLYREIRIDNTLKDGKGRKVKLKQGAHVEVTVEADPKETVPKNKTEK
jgi:hypothetical protein